jgi:hypothetical protein
MSYQAVLDTCSAALFTRTREHPSAVSLALHGFFDPGWLAADTAFFGLWRAARGEACESLTTVIEILKMGDLRRRLRTQRVENGDGLARVPLDSGESLPEEMNKRLSQDRSSAAEHEKLAVGAATVKKYSDAQSSSLAALPRTGDDPGLGAVG